MINATYKLYLTKSNRQSQTGTYIKEKNRLEEILS